MSAAFDRAWAVLKEDWESLGIGGYRQVSRGPDPDLAYKRPHATLPPMTAPPTFARDVATGQALAQMGLPFAPETPVLDPETNGLMTTQALAPDRSMSSVWDRNWDREQWNEMENEFFDAMGPELGGGTKTWNERGPLLEALGVSDIKPDNVGVYEGGPKVIDFETNIGHEDPVGSGDMYWGHLRALPWAHVPKEQRQEFIDRYSDKAMFDPVQSTSDPAWNQEWSRYLNTIRNLQFFNDLVENPEQRRLFEFDADADPNDARQVGVIRDTLSQMNVPRETV